MIIDAKYYKDGHWQKSRYGGGHKLRADHLYQIFSYVKNESLSERSKNKEISGMLLYALSEQSGACRLSHRMSGHQISVQTVDLNCSFADITQQLDNIVFGYFGKYINRI